MTWKAQQEKINFVLPKFKSLSIKGYHQEIFKKALKREKIFENHVSDVRFAIRIDEEYV